MSNQLRIKHIWKSLLVLFFPLLLTAYSLLHITTASASELQLGIQPPIIQIDATAPTDIRHPVSIKNGSDQPTTLSITLRPFRSKDDLGHVDFVDEKDLQLRDKNIFQKIQVLDGDNPVNEVTLGPQEEKQLTLKIGLPKDEPPADYYFSIVFLSKNPEGNSNGSSIAGGIASNVLLSIGPKDPARGFIEKFNSPIYVTNGPIPFSVSVQNLSPYYISPQGHIFIRNLYDQLIGTVDLLQVNVLANSSRTLTDTSQFMPGKAVWNEQFLFGPYKATLTVALSPEGPIYQRTIYFFALPLQYLIGITLMIVIGIFLFTRVKKRIKQV